MVNLLQNEITSTTLREEGIRSGDLVWLLGSTPGLPSTGAAESRSQPEETAQLAHAMPPKGHQQQQVPDSSGLDGASSHKRPLGPEEGKQAMEVVLIQTSLPP
jgi:hypothetical protein